jgi:hypothetical protein
MWAYVEFMIHLRGKDFTDMGGVESHAWHHLTIRSMRWLPRYKVL